jgi:hypothetical protein
MPLATKAAFSAAFFIPAEFELGGQLAIRWLVNGK